MFRAAIISPDEDLGRHLEEAFQRAGQFGVVRLSDRYLSEEELARMLRAHAPEVLFISIDSIKKALDTAVTVEKLVPGTPVIACSRSCDQSTLLQLMRGGIRDLISYPFRSQTILELAERLGDVLDKAPSRFLSTDLMFAFLPSKPGVGTSTVAVNTALALASQPDCKTLLADFDMNCGLISFMLKMDNPYTVVDACEKSGSLDEVVWPQLVSSAGDLDVLSSGKSSPEFRIEMMQLRRLMNFARRFYKTVCVDLSGNLEKFSLELMQESKRIFLVTTPEIPSLHLARERFTLLNSLDLGDRVSILINRWHKRAVISVAHIEELFGVPVLATFPNDYQEVHSALTEGRGVSSQTELGRQFTELAQRLLSQETVAESVAKRKLVEYFSIIPARYSMFSGPK